MANSRRFIAIKRGMLIGFACVGLAEVPVAAQNNMTPLSTEAALASDATSYAQDYRVSREEAQRRIRLMANAGSQLETIRREIGSGLSGIYFDNGPSFRLVVRTTGPVYSARTVSVGQDRLPVYFAAAPVTQTAALNALRTGAQRIKGLLPSMQATSYDERTSEVVVLVNGNRANEASLKTQGRILAGLLRVPVRIDVEPVVMKPTAIRGGAPTYLSNATPWCTTAFVATNSAGQRGVLTAGHCTTQQQFWREGTTATPFSATTHYDGARDFAFMRNSVTTVPEFIGNRNEAPRILRGRRTKANTAVGAYVCMYGRNTGPVYGQTCGEVASKTFNPNYGPPNYPNGCSNGPSYVACQPNFVEVRARAGETMYCRGGDSGAPVFAFDVAFGIESGCAIYSGTDQTYNFVYTSTDEIYNLGYALAYGS